MLRVDKRAVGASTGTYVSVWTRTAHKYFRNSRATSQPPSGSCVRAQRSLGTAAEALRAATRSETSWTRERKLVLDMFFGSHPNRKQKVVLDTSNSRQVAL